MDKKSRVQLALTLIEKLSSADLDFESTNLILRTYGLKTLSVEFGGPSLHDIVSYADDDQLIELGDYFELDVPKTGAPKSQVVTLSSSHPLVIFGSHLSEHKVLVGTVREELLKYGIDLFVAHDTIEHDKLWQDEIEKALAVVDAGLVFVHEGLRDSSWCDQEIGWMLGRGVPVMALKFDGTPYGFFAKHQAQPVPRGATASEIAEMTVDRIASKPELATAFAASLVSAIARSPKFATTDAIWKRLRELTTLDANLCSQLLTATKCNTQIHWASSPLDGGASYKRVICGFLRRQPGAALIISDIDAYEAFLDDEDAEAARTQEEVNRRLRERLAAGEAPF